MPAITKPLTNTEITHAKPKEKEYNLTDGGGLVLRVKPNGTKSWLFNYKKVISKKRTNLGLGVFPEISLAQARQIRAEYRALLAQGIDPQAHREEQEALRQQTAENTLYAVAEKWRDKREKEVKARTVTVHWQMLELHLFPRLGQRPISEITPRILVEALKPLEKQGKLLTIKRVIYDVRNIMRFAVNCGILEFSKCETVGGAFTKHESENYKSISPEETPEFISRLEAYQRESHNHRLNALAIKWQLLTMVRPTEAIRAKWEEIDFDNRLWTIPAERMKKGKAHIVPLSRQALDVLNELRAIMSFGIPNIYSNITAAVGGYIFPILRLSCKNWQDSKPRQDRVVRTLHKLGYKDRLTAHGLRSIARTYLADQGVNWEVAETCLAHAVGNTTSRAYDRSNYLEQRKPVMQQWADFLTACGMTTKANLIDR